MIVFHCCSYKKLQIYIKNGYIKNPVRAWENIQEAERFSIQTGRKIILRLKFPKNCKKLEGHKNKAFVLMSDYKMNNF